MKKLIIGLCLMLLCGCSNEVSYKAIIADEAYKNMKNNEDIIVMDVRSNMEYNNTHIVDAINVPLNTIDKSLDIGKDEIIYVYCESGNRSKLAVESLISLGYKKVYDLGGINNWPYETE